MLIWVEHGFLNFRLDRRSQIITKKQRNTCIYLCEINAKLKWINENDKHVREKLLFSAHSTTGMYFPSLSNWPEVLFYWHKITFLGKHIYVFLSIFSFRNHLNSSCAVVSNSVPDINAWSVQPCSQTRAYVCRKPQGKFMYTLGDAAFKSSFKYMRFMLHKQ